MRAIRTETTIAAAPAAVWSVLTDFASYPEWNPLIVEAEGDLGEGARLRLRLQLPGRKPMTLRPRLIAVRPARHLAWLGHVGVPGIFDGEHHFELEPVEAGTRLVHREEFRGLLAPVLVRMIGDATEAGFEALNGALATRVEQRAPAR